MPATNNTQVFPLVYVDINNVPHEYNLQKVTSIRHGRVGSQFYIELRAGGREVARLLFADESWRNSQFDSLFALIGSGAVAGLTPITLTWGD
jgi:hypothetical protein